MKPLILPAVTLTTILAAQMLVPEAERSVPYAFDPAKVQQNLCGPVGQGRGYLFRPDVARLMSNAVFAAEPDAVDVPLLTGLDTRDFAISSANADARAYFRQGFALLYGFNHWEAIRAFKKAQMLDPDCAICHWGEAVALGPNINAPMDDASHVAALAAIQKAVTLKEFASAREAALIDALAVRYSADPAAKRADLDQAYADAMAGVVAQFPDDQDIATLYAEALMDTSPWDYWERDFTTPKPHIQTALNTIERVLAANPDHYGSIHLYIHLYEASTMAGKAAPFADKLAGLAPGAGHLVHMPGHTYFRIGRYLDSLDTNIKAVAVDEAYLAETSGSQLYRYGYFPHNVHFVLVSAQMAGDAPAALEYARKLDPLVPMAVLAEAEWIAPIKAAPYFVYGQFGSVGDVMALPDPGDTNAYLRAMWHYARGNVLAAAGDVRAADEKAAIDALMADDRIKNAGIPAGAILKLASRSIEARALMAAGQYDAAADIWRDVVKTQDSMGYTEPPHWYYAAEQSLGAALYGAEDYAGAVEAFEASLVRHPNSAWSLFGLMKAQQKLGQMGEASVTQGLLDKASRSRGDVPLIRL